MKSTTPGLRERKKAETRRTIQQNAIRLFLAQGYDATTVEQIAAESGVSHMTFFRYFPTKESVVQNDEYDPMLVQLIRNRPAGESPMTALRRGMREVFGQVYAQDRTMILERSRLMLRTPALRGKSLEQVGTGEAMVLALAARAGTEPTLEIEVIAAAAISALVVAIGTWVDGDGADELPDLVDRAFAALTP